MVPPPASLEEMQHVSRVAFFFFLKPDTSVSQVCLTRENSRFWNQSSSTILGSSSVVQWFRLRAVLTEEVKRAGWGHGLKAAQLMETCDSLDRPDRRKVLLVCCKAEIQNFSLCGKISIAKSFHDALIRLWSCWSYMTKILKGSTHPQLISLILPDPFY